MLTITVGHSESVDANDAIVEILDACRADLGDAVPQAGVLFAAIDFDHQALLDGIEKAYPGLELIGCTTDGEASSVAGFAEDSVTLMLMHSDVVSIRAGLGRNARSDPEGAARAAVHSAREGSGSPPRLCITVPEGLGTNTHAILGGLTATLGEEVPICGGMSGDQLRFKETYQFYKGGVFTDSVPVLLFSGDFLFSYGVASGWNPIGDRHRVTRAEGNVIFTIDDKPAKDLYTRYLEEHSLYYPLAVYPDGGDDFFLATPAAFDEENGSIVCQNTVPEGAEVQLAEASRDEIISGAASSSRLALENYPGSNPTGGLIFSCAGRRAVLGTRTREEIQLLGDEMAIEVPMTGFYTYGELCPLPTSRDARSHNCTFVTVLMGES